MRSEWIEKGEMEHVLAVLMPENRLACEISLATGLRINDVLSLKASDVKKQRFTIREQKTGKTRSVYLPAPLWRACLENSGQIFVFPHRLNGREHRTRQAVFKDLKRAAKAFRCTENVCPHSLRKIYATCEFEKHHDLKRVQRLLNHSDEAVTMIYAMANSIRRFPKKKLDKS